MALSTPSHIWLSCCLSANPTTYSHFFAYLYFCHFLAPHLCLSLFTVHHILTRSYLWCAHMGAHTVNLKGNAGEGAERPAIILVYILPTLQRAAWVNPWWWWLFLCLSVHAHCVRVCACVWICNYKTSVQCEAICRPTTGCDSEL